MHFCLLLLERCSRLENFEIDFEPNKIVACIFYVEANF